jgi:hypothetical protein
MGYSAEDGMKGDEMEPRAASPDKEMVGDGDLTDVDWVLTQVNARCSDIKAMRENWMEIVKMWIVLLAWRHLERTAPAEGGAEERFREPVRM